MLDLLKIKVLLVQKGINQTDLAKAIGKSTAQTSYILNKANCDISILQKMADFLEVEPSILLK
jgi:DNA-binding Xre family transcriptional regulator